ncbi:hypothetical protein QYE76_007376 [Lolium multiflorum]|uniref:SAUR family protein n=1 Tax=Lolium multiflorum TaxID=4521 RepID=A0AAD8W596_LOLMU|nr:hypothetical protein QYE76_007376 [Lolium multiflorum]
MIHPKKLAQLAKKWQRKVAAGAGGQQADECCSTVADKGHCVVYTADGARFEVPLAYLGTTVFGELLRMSGEEFGFTNSEGGRITLPCDAVVMEYVLCLVRRDASEEVEKAFLSSIAGHCCSYTSSYMVPSMEISHELALCT